MTFVTKSNSSFNTTNKRSLTSSQVRHHPPTPQVCPPQQHSIKDCVLFPYSTTNAAWTPPPPRQKKSNVSHQQKTPGGRRRGRGGSGRGVVYFKRSCQKEHVFVLINLQKNSNPKIIILSIHFQLLSHTDWPPTHPAGRGRNNNSWRSSSVSPVLLLQVQSGYSTELLVKWTRDQTGCQFESCPRSCSSSPDSSSSTSSSSIFSTFELKHQPLIKTSSHSLKQLD